jgi:diguanylate cyclase (GGDEF)-like protein
VLGRKRSMRVRLWLGLAVVASIAIGSVLVGAIVHSREVDSFERAQRDEALRSAHQAEALASFSVGQLSSAAAFYKAEGSFSRHEFEILSDSLLEAGILAGTAFVQAVPQAERASFERSRGYPIVERAPIGFRRARPHAEYFPLVFVAAKGLDLTPPLGFDLGSDPVRSSFLARARDSGEPAATPVIRLVLGGTGINVFRPVYADGEPTATVAERRAALTGFATGSFHVPDLAATLTAPLSEDVDAQLLEHGRTIVGPELPRDEAAAVPVQIADRAWLLVVRDPNRPGMSLPVLIAVLGISLAALLGALVLIWSRNERMQELQLQASQDSLTGLKNRRRFEEDLRTELARSHRERSEGAVLMLDLDRFKLVNDTLGHPIGDRVIEEIAGVLRRRTRETDVLARLGGDEFAIVLPRCNEKEARTVAEAIASGIREHAPEVEGLPPLSASIGIAIFGVGDHVSFESVLKDADAAMYAAKEAGRDEIKLFAHGQAGVRSAT